MIVVSLRQTAIACTTLNKCLSHFDTRRNAILTHLCLCNTRKTVDIIYRRFIFEHIGRSRSKRIAAIALPGDGLGMHFAFMGWLLIIIRKICKRRFHIHRKIKLVLRNDINQKCQDSQFDIGYILATNTNVSPPKLKYLVFEGNQKFPNNTT